MTIATEQAKSVYLRLALRVGVWDGITPPTKYSDYLNFEKAEFTVPEQETDKIISNIGDDGYGGVLDSQSKATDKTATVSLEFSTLTPTMIALALGANLSEVTQASSTKTDEPVTTELDAWVYLGVSGISDFSLEKSSVAVDASKYELDAERGLIKAIHADAVGSCTFSCDVDAITWEDYAAGLAKSTYVHLMGTATEMKTGKKAPIDVWRAQLVPDGTFDPLSGGFLKGKLKGDLITPSEPILGAIPTSPWRFRLRTT